MKNSAHRTAQVEYSKDNRTLEVVLPRGTKLKDFAKVFEYLANDIFSKLPRGCTPCTSGDHLIIREELDPIIRVDLEQRTTVPG